MIKPLTSLRFIFALFVFVSHLGIFKNSESENVTWIYLSILKEGYLGVSFFFILSGFILAYNYQDKFIINNYSIRKFLIARFARIYPLHFLTFFVSIPLVIYGIKDFSLLLIFKSITNLTLTQSFVPLKSIYFSFNAPSWSISNEMFFYILFPFILTFVGFFRKKWFLLLLVFASIPLLSIIISNDFHHRLFYINPVFRIVDFVIGISLYNLYRLIKNMNLNFNYNYIEISSVILFSVFFFFHSDFPKVSRYSFFYWIPMSYIILVFSFQKGIISKFLSQKWLIYLGEISFGFYMFHQLVIRYFLPLNNRYLGIENEIHQSLMIFILSLLISHYSFKYFENPINSYLKNKLHRKNYTQHRL